MRTNKFSILVGVAVLALTVGLNVRHALNDYGVKTNKLHVEVLAQTSTTGGGSTSGGGSSSGSGSVEWNDWTQWLTQGFTKDEREIIEVCPSSQSTSVTGNASSNGTSVGGSYDSSQTNSSARHDIRCASGNVNCTSVKC